jgi:TatD related DNase
MQDTAKMGLGGCDSSFGTVSFVTGVFGLVAAGIVARIIAMQPTATDSNTDISDSSSTDNDTDGSTSSGSGTTTDAATAASDSYDPAQWRWSHHALRNINKQKAAAVEAPDGHSDKSDAPTDSGESTAAINTTTNAANTISSSSSSSSTVAAGDSASAVNTAVTDSASAVAVANGQQQQAVEPRLTGLIDAHCHLQMVANSSSSIRAVHDEVTAAQAAGVERAVVCATSTEDWAAVDTLATQVHKSCMLLQ